VAVWSQVQVDASLWGFGATSLLRYRVSEAAERARVLRFRTIFVGYVPGDAIRPRAWPAPPAAGPWADLRPLMATEAEWVESVEAGGHRGMQQRTNAEWEAGVLPARWMQPRGPPRVPVYERVARRGDDDAAQPPPRPPAPLPWDGLQDVLRRPSDHVRPPWQGVYSRLRHPALDRAQRSWAWQLLHGALLPRAALVSYNTSLPCEDGFCTHPGCHRVPETITHALLDCPLAIRVTTWLCDLWDAVTGGGNRPPRTGAVLLGDDQRAWQPRAPLLWTVLRLATLYALWWAGRHRSDDGAATNAACMAAKVVYGCRRLMQQDWCRVTHDVRAFSAVPVHWFRGRDSALTVEEFSARWCVGGVLARVQDGHVGRGVLELLWTCSHPLPLP